LICSSVTVAPSTGDDHVFESLHQGHVAIGIKSGHIAGVKPAIHNGLSGGHWHQGGPSPGERRSG
jgi:hypothetical protein